MADEGPPERYLKARNLINARQYRRATLLYCQGTDPKDGIIPLVDDIREFGGIDADMGMEYMIWSVAKMEAAVARSARSVLDILTEGASQAGRTPNL